MKWLSKVTQDGVSRTKLNCWGENVKCCLTPPPDLGVWILDAKWWRYLGGTSLEETGHQWMGLTGFGMLSFKWHIRLIDQQNTACKLPHASASMPSWLQQTVLPQTKSQNKSSSISFSLDSPSQQGEKSAPRFCLIPISICGEVISLLPRICPRDSHNWEMPLAC